MPPIYEGPTQVSSMRIGALAVAAAYNGGQSLLAPAGPVSFSVLLSNPTNGVLTNASAVVTITNVGKINPVINATRITGTAPLAITFDAVSTQVDPALTTKPVHECHYAWHFGDSVADAQTWSYGPKAGSASKNTAYGPVAGHVFEQAGSYTVTLTVTHLSSAGIYTTSSKTLTVTVAAADTTWAANTIYISSSGVPVPGSGGVPAGANVQQVMSWSQIGTLANTYKRILLKRGDTWTTDGAATITAQGPGMIGAYGAGNKPEITVVADAGVIGLNKVTDWRLIDLKMIGNGVRGAGKNFVSFSGGSHYLFQRLEISDAHIGIGSDKDTENVQPIGIAIVECSMGDAYVYDAGPIASEPVAYLALTNYMSIMGCHFYNSPVTHVCRLQGTAYTCVTNNTIEMAGPTRQALTVRGKTTSAVPDGNGHYPWNGTWTENVVVSDNIIDNSVRGGYTLYTGPQSIGHGEHVRDVLIERNIIKCREAVVVQAAIGPRLTIRNNIIVALYSAGIGLNLSGNAAGAPVMQDAAIYNNSIYKPDISYYNGFAAVSIFDSALGSGNNIYNNLSYAPADTKDGNGNGTAPTFVSFGGAAGTDGINYTLTNNSTDAQVKNTNPFVNPSLEYSGFVPSGYPVNSGVFSPAYFDFMRAPPSAQSDMGAIWS